jgi:hypothetical protein
MVRGGHIVGISAFCMADIPISALLRVLGCGYDSADSEPKQASLAKAALRHRFIGLGRVRGPCGTACRADAAPQG